MKVSRIDYSARGRMLEPDARHVAAASPVAGAPVSTEPGYYHVAKAEGRNEQEMRAAAERLSAELKRSPHTITVLSTRRYRYSLWTSERVGVEIVYAVGPTTLETRRQHTAKAVALR